MNVLYLGPYRQTDGWGQASRSVASLLNTIPDINLEIRPLWLNNEVGVTKLGDLDIAETNRLSSHDIVIQHTLPNHMVYDGTFSQNIGITSVDCRMKGSSWVDSLNRMDKVIVFTDHESDMLRYSGVTVPIESLVFAPLTPSGSTQALEFPDARFRMYSTASLDPRSGLDELLIAYLASFRPEHGALLMLMSDDQDKLKEKIHGIKRAMGLYNNDDQYPHICVINSTHQSVINALHDHCNVFIDVSFDARPSLIATRAMLSGNLPIILDTYPAVNGSLCVESYRERIVYANRPLRELYTAHNTWCRPYIESLCDAFKSLLRLPDLHASINACQADVSNEVFQHSNTMKDILCSQ